MAALGAQGARAHQKSGGMKVQGSASCRFPHCHLQRPLIASFGGAWPQGVGQCSSSPHAPPAWGASG
eukprot:6754743-Alexandrium_andersonii.AAC.1